MLNLLHNADITFNLHGSIAGNCAGNLRMFEASGAGSCLVTDNKVNITDLFEPDREIVVYNSSDECIEKIKYLLDHPMERAQIALAGQKRTLEQHNMENRIRKFDNFIQSVLQQ
jgi:spore maturation protein CgeB